jgi:hypothetical protein
LFDVFYQFEWMNVAFSKKKKNTHVKEPTIKIFI